MSRSILYYITDVTSIPVSSELCSNQQQATIQEFLWFNGNQRGCSITPNQNIFLGPWISFPNAPSLIPVNHDRVTTSIDQANELYLLIETDTKPCLINENVLMVGQLYIFLYICIMSMYHILFES